MPSVKGVPDFVRLTDSISIYKPDVKSTQEGALQTIVLCAWFRALPKHIAKYTAAHRLRTPNAQILLIQSSVADMLFTSATNQRSNLRPAVEVLKAAQAERHNILLHIFSNGGTNSALQLAHAWRTDTQKPLPITAMALDSCPGSPNYKLAAAAVVMSFPKNQQWWAVFFVWGVVMPLFTVPLLWGSPNLVAWLREGLNDPTLFAHTVPRVYLYSAADHMVPSDAVREHCASAHNAGYHASLVRFRNSPHVAHVNADKEKYWGAVDAVQKAAGRRAATQRP